MQSRVVGLMQSWRGWLNTAGLGRRSGQETPAGAAGVIRADSGSGVVMDDEAAPAAAARTSRGAGDPDGRRGAGDRTATATRDPAADGAAAGPGARGGWGPERSRVPSWLQTGAAWSWRLLIIAIVVYLAARAIGVLYVVVVPCVAALLLTALLPETKHTVAQVQSLLSGPPFHVKSSTVKNFLDNIPSFLSKHRSLVAGTLVTGGKIAAEFFGGLVLMLFVMFFLIKDGERIWGWLLGKMQPHNARRWDRAGRASWTAVVYYMRGTVVVAAIHGVVVGLALWIMGVPLALPLAVLVFIAAFVPLVGLLVAGALAVVVTLVAKGWLDALILVIVLVVEDQLEAHLLQPQVVGRVIRLHPLAVILALAVGSVLAGIPGALVAVPVVAVLTRALPELGRREPPDPDPPDPDPPDPPDPGGA